MSRYVTGSEAARRARLNATSMMQGHALDAVDVRILQTLQNEGRTTNVNLAKSVGITAPSTLRRTAVLEERGIIRGYHADLDPGKFGYGVIAFITVGLQSQADQAIKAFENLMRMLPNVRECHALSGHRDFLLKGVFRNLTESHAFVTDVLLKTPNVVTVHTAFAIAKIKNVPGVPVMLISAKRQTPEHKLKLPPAPRERRA